MLSEFEGLFIKKSKYQDGSFIITVYTKLEGLLPLIFFIKKSYFNNTILVPFVKVFGFYYKKFLNEVFRIKDLTIQPEYELINSPAYKQVAFSIIAQIINLTLPKRKPDLCIYDLLIDIKNIILKNNQSHITLWILWFLKEFIAKLGINPILNFSLNTPYFDISQGKFVCNPSFFSLPFEQSIEVFNVFSSQNFDDLKNCINSSSFFYLLDFFEKYFNVHWNSNLNFQFIKEYIINFDDFYHS